MQAQNIYKPLTTEEIGFHLKVNVVEALTAQCEPPVTIYPLRMREEKYTQYGL